MTTTDVREEEDSSPTNPRGWSDKEWLRATWERANAAEAAAKEAAKQSTMAVAGVLTVNRNVATVQREMRNGFVRLGVRMRDITSRAADSQVDAAEAKRRADEAEAAVVKTFVEDAKPFSRWKRDLVGAAIGVAVTLAGAAVAKECGLPLETEHAVHHHD